MKIDNEIIRRSNLKAALTEYFTDGTLDCISAKLAFNMILKKIDESPAIPIIQEDSTSCYYCRHNQISADKYPCVECKHSHINKFEPKEGADDDVQ